MPIDYSKSKVFLFYDKDDESKHLLMPSVQLTAGHAYSNARKKSVLASIPKASVRHRVVSTFACHSKDELNEMFKRVALRDTTIRSDIAGIIRNHKPDANEATVSMYATSWLALQAYSGDLFFASNFDKTIELIQSMWPSFESQRNQLKAVCAVLEDGEDMKARYQQLLYDWTGKSMQRADENTMTERQMSKWCDWPDVQRKFKVLMDEYERTGVVTTQLIVCSFYVAQFGMGVWRLKELRFLEATGCYDKPCNLIDWTKRELVLCIYKTADKYGCVYDKVSAKFIRMLQCYADRPGRKSCYLLETNKGQQVSNQYIQTILEQTFGCSANILRHSWTTWLFDQGKLKTMTQIRKNAALMRHSIMQTLQYRLEKPQDKALLVQNDNDDEDM